MQRLSCKVVGRIDVLDGMLRAVFDIYGRDGIVVVSGQKATTETVECDGSISIISKIYKCWTRLVRLRI